MDCFIRERKHRRLKTAPGCNILSEITFIIPILIIKCCYLLFLFLNSGVANQKTVTICSSIRAKVLVFLA